MWVKCLLIANVLLVARETELMRTNDALHEIAYST